MRGTFLSYRRSDTAGHVGRLHDHLAARFGAERVFIDMGDITAGEDFTRALEREVARADVVLVVIGNGWLAASEGGRRRLDDPGDHHRREIEAAIAQGKRIVPVLVEGARMPRDTELPEPLRALARCQAVELRDARWTDDVAALARAVESDASPQSGPAIPGEGRDGSTIKLGLVALAGALAVISAYSTFRPPRDGASSTTTASSASSTRTAATPDAAALAGLWIRENGSRWMIMAEGRELRIEEIHHDSKQPWLRGSGEWEGEQLQVTLAHLYGSGLRLEGTLRLAPDDRTLSGRLRSEPGGEEQTIVLVRQ